jgi:hypothetical protein
MAALRRSCKTCRKQFTPRRGTRRVNCYACRPERLASGPESMAVESVDAVRFDGEMQQAVRVELERLAAVASVAGAVALRLARSLDDPALGAAQVSSISAQLIRTLEPLQKKAPREPDGMDRATAAVLQLVRGA